MDYFKDVLTTFLGIERGSCVTVRKLPDYIKNILIFAPRWTKIFWVWNDMKVIN